jgi:hypothetical protein
MDCEIERPSPVPPALVVEERIEQARHDFARNSNSGVEHAQAAHADARGRGPRDAGRMAVARRRGVAPRSARAVVLAPAARTLVRPFPPGRDAEFERERAAARHRLRGVDDDVQEHLLDQARIDVQPREAARDAGHDRNLSVGQVLGLELEDLRDHVLEPRQPEPGLGRTRELEQARDDAVEAVHLVDDDAAELLAVVPRLEPREQDLGRGGDPGKRIADLVRHTGRELADRGQPLAQAQLALQPLGLREVPEDGDRASAGEPGHGHERGDFALFAREHERLPRARLARGGLAEQVLAGHGRA